MSVEQHFLHCFAERKPDRRNIPDFPFPLFLRDDEDAREYRKQFGCTFEKSGTLKGEGPWKNSEALLRWLNFWWWLLWLRFLLPFWCLRWERRGKLRKKLPVQATRNSLALWVFPMEMIMRNLLRIMCTIPGRTRVSTGMNCWGDIWGGNPAGPRHCIVPEGGQNPWQRLRFSCVRAGNGAAIRTTSFISRSVISAMCRMSMTVRNRLLPTAGPRCLRWSDPLCGFSFLSCQIL